VDCRPRIESRQAYADAEPFHGIPPDRQERAFADGWTIPWVLANAQPLPSPVPYEHPFGAITWVNLDDAVVEATLSQLADRPSASGSLVTWDPARPFSAADKAPISNKHALSPEPALTSATAETRCVIVTGGNIRNNHINLLLDFFPGDAIGGSNKSTAARRSISVTFQPGMTVQTDIDGTKRILRVRGPVRDFLTRAGVKDGDTVLITRTAPYAYAISKAPHL
jgi:hypothetical protein